MCIYLGGGSFFCRSDCFSTDGWVPGPTDARIARLVFRWRVQKAIAGMPTATRVAFAKSVGAHGTSVRAVVAVLSRRILAEKGAET